MTEQSAEYARVPIALIDQWRATRDGVLSPGLRRAADDLAAAIKADNDATDRRDYAAFIGADGNES